MKDSPLKEHEIVKQVYAAKESTRAADDLVRYYLPFIKKECAKFLGRPPEEGYDDELGIAMFAFHEAAQAYEKGRGAFLSFAARAIKNRLIDYTRQERRHRGHLSLDAPAGDEEDSPSLLDTVDTGHDVIESKLALEATKAEIADFASQLAQFGLSPADVAENSPRQERTLAACKRALAYARKNKELLEELVRTKKIPMGSLAEGSGVDRKTLERHRRYLVALLLAYTNGFEIIRGHLRRTVSGKGDA